MNEILPFKNNFTVSFAEVSAFVIDKMPRLNKIELAAKTAKIKSRIDGVIKQLKQENITDDTQYLTAIYNFTLKKYEPIDQDEIGSLIEQKGDELLKFLLEKYDSTEGLVFGYLFENSEEILSQLSEQK